MTKREQLARAAAKAHNGLDNPEPSHFAMVDAILAELREPDDKMTKGCVDAMPEHANWLNQRAAFLIWQAMIDAIE